MEGSINLNIKKSKQIALTLNIRMFCLRSAISAIHSRLIITQLFLLYRSNNLIVNLIFFHSPNRVSNRLLHSKKHVESDPARDRCLHESIDEYIS